MTKTFGIAFRNLYRQRRRSALAVVAVGFGVVALVLAGGFIEWGLWFGRDSTIHSQLGHIQIVRQDYYEKGIADPYHYLLPKTSPELGKISALPGVETVGPRLSLSGLASLGDATISFIGEGVDPASERNLSRSLTIRSGSNLAEDDPKGIILGQGLAANLGTKVGDHIVLLSSPAKGGMNATEVKVRGIFSTITKAYDDVALRMPIELARKLVRVDGAHVWVMLLKDTEQTKGRLAEVKSILGKSGLQAIEWRELADFYNKSETLLLKQFGTVKTIIAIIIVLSISNTMMMSVMERTGEIGTMMALGIRRKSVMQLFLTEGLLLGVVGAGMGLVVGCALAYVISLVGIPMPPPPGMADSYTARILVTGSLAGQAFVLAVITTLLASIYPSWKASRMQIVDALRTNR